MRLSRRAVLGVLVTCAIVGGGAVAWYRTRPPAFPRYTIDADGSVIKRLPILSSESLARVPSLQMKGLIFGIHPFLLETTATHTENVERIVFVVENEPSDIRREYEEYFAAIGWSYSLSQDMTRLTIQTADAYTAISIAPREYGGSLIAITRSQIP
ncbi:MAG: hypothetical protein IT405_00815 [Candidatus Yanofskybacteria bacterium]|nr:hypothetical protein [Candidatus Yanofskybacteria bacterium]